MDLTFPFSFYLLNSGACRFYPVKQCKTESHPESSLRSMYSVLYTTDFPTCKPLTKACSLGSSPDNLSMIFPLKLGGR
jgi:hypothetical protein